jgi:polysaccharide pyruvyl transferase WcaK-like protein
MDVILTTRLHGTVLALKNAVPVIAVDSVAGGGKVVRQCEALGWPVVFRIEDCSDEKLTCALEHCLGAAAKQEALACRQRAVSLLAPLEQQFAARFEDFGLRGRPS